VRIGVDVGGTNTDAALMDGNRIVASIKSPTTRDIATGIISVVRKLLGLAKVSPATIKAVMIGTTQFTNAFVEGRRLNEVGVIRLCLPAASSLMPLSGWPASLKSAVGCHHYLVPGGYEFDGREIAVFDEGQVLAAVRSIKRKGLQSVAISSVFSPINSAMEERAEDILRNEIPEISITLSSRIGKIGLIERENAAIMNASLATLSREVVGSFRDALESLEITAPFLISQNDGTLMQADQVEAYPVLTFSSGPTNSMRGAAFLSGLKDAIVVDIGGTTSDVGVLVNGYPRESSVPVDIGGVRTNFRMPDILAIGLGGGSRVRLPEKGNNLSIGPDSVGYELLSKSLVFGGDVLTATDLVVAGGYADIGDVSRITHLPKAVVKAGLTQMRQMIEGAIDKMKTRAADVPVILVGGGAVLVTDTLQGASQLCIPERSAEANAIGAAMAQVGGEVDKVYAYERQNREDVLKAAKEEAIQKALEANADPETVAIIDVEEIPLAYSGGASVRVRVKAVGDFLHPCALTSDSGMEV
jgi:N-methylhydantoinase A/oxoprolinase/acetone carboxylase beta subunit